MFTPLEFTRILRAWFNWYCTVFPSGVVDVTIMGRLTICCDDCERGLVGGTEDFGGGAEEDLDDGWVGLTGGLEVDDWGAVLEVGALRLVDTAPKCVDPSPTLEVVWTGSADNESAAPIEELASPCSTFDFVFSKWGISTRKRRLSYSSSIRL